MLVVGLALAGCAKKQETAGMESTTAPADTSQAMAAALTDPNIAAIVIAANDVDIDGGKVAQSKGHNAQVKEFGKRMVTDHTSANQLVKDLASRLALTPEDNDTSNKIRSDGKAMKDRLAQMAGAAFDRAYIDNEIMMHETVLNAIDNSLIPNAQNADLKALLEKIRPIVQDHLANAKRVQSSLGTAG